VIGGSSAINAMIYMRGQAADYDHWRQLRLSGWGWNDVLPFFRRREDRPSAPATRMRSAANGASGAARAQDILDAFRDAASEAGIKPIPDFNTGDNEARAFHVNQKRGRRWSATFLKPALGRPSLRHKPVPVEGIVFDSKRAAGVRWRHNGESRSALSQRGGPRGRLDRLGPDPQTVRRRSARELAESGIASVLDRPGVGENLQDHLQPAHLQDRGRQDAQRRLSLRVGPCA
jgi:choline dehydrogenase-like flavoprotein